MKIITRLIILILVCNAFASSQMIHPRNKAQVIFHTIVRPDSSAGYYYSYSLTNRDISEEACDNFRLLLTDSLLTNDYNKVTKPINKKWYIDGSEQGFITGSAANRFLNLPIAPDDALFPGETMFISFRSYGLPSITYYYAQSFSLPLTIEEYDSLHALGYSDKQINPNWKVKSYKNQTVTPNTNLFNLTILNFLDTLAGYTAQSISLGWIKDQTTANKYLTYFSSARTKLAQSDSVGARNVLLQVLSDVNVDSTSILSSEAYSLLRFNTEYLVNKLPQAQTASFFAVKLVSSTGMKLTSGSLQYYDGSWKNATNNQDGTFSINTTLKTLSLRMTYEYGIQTKSNVPISTDTIVFQTVNAQIQLQNSSGTLIDTGTVQYYAGAWRNFGTTINGVAAKELLPASYSFRMTYAYASNDKQQNLDSSSTVIFKTTNAQVQLQNSSGALIDTGMVQYYSGAWRDLGTTINGIATKELLPNSYSFRMNYAYASKDKQQDISTNPTVVFQTVNVVVQLKNSQGTLLDQGTVLYYSGAWRAFGSTSNGVSYKELLPNSYSFRMTYANASKDQQQDIGTNATVIFQTVKAQVQLQNSGGALIDTGVVQYYSGSWLPLGTTVSGIASKELLPNSYSFRMNYAYASKDKQQDIGSNATVIFQTVNTAVHLKNSSGALMDTGAVQYYSGAWRSFGTTANGVANKELLPNSYSFRMMHQFISLDKTQDVSTNSTVTFATVLCTINVKDLQSNPLSNAQASYYSGAWRIIGMTANGQITKELLPLSLSFRVSYNGKTQDKTQNLSTNNIVDFVMP